MSIVGENIKKYRELQNLKQSELGVLIGRTASAVSNWEKGINQPDVIVIEKLLKIFAIDANTLFDWDAVDQQSVREELLVRQLRQLSIEGQENVLDYVEILLMSGRYKKYYSDGSLEKEA
jgi:transcriptional regulator with XRE-family HTH domain